MTVKLHINGNIGEVDPMLEAMGIEQNTISSNDVANFLSENKDADTIIVEIRSNGGSVSHGFDIYDQLINSGKKIITKGYRVNSIATVIFLSGNERYLSKNAEFIIHNPWIDAESLAGMALTADVLKEISEDVKQSEEKIYKFYSKVLKLNDSDKLAIKQMMDKDSDIGTETAIQYGFAHGLIEDFKKKQSSKNNAAYTELILAKIKSNNRTMNQNEVHDKLTGLEKAVNKLQNLFKTKVKNATATLEDGTMLWFDGESLEVGMTVYTDEEMGTLAPDGVHTLSDGRTIEVLDGVVLSITDAEETTEETTEEAAPSVTEEEVAALKSEIETLTAERDELISKIENKKKSEKEYSDTVNNLKNEIKSLKEIVAGDVKKNATVKNNKLSSDAPAWKKRLEVDRQYRDKF